MLNKSFGKDERKRIVKIKKELVWYIWLLLNTSSSVYLMLRDPLIQTIYIAINKPWSIVSFTSFVLTGLQRNLLSDGCIKVTNNHELMNNFCDIVDQICL